MEKLQCRQSIVLNQELSKTYIDTPVQSKLQDLLSKVLSSSDGQLILKTYKIKPLH